MTAASSAAAPRGMLLVELARTRADFDRQVAGREDEVRIGLHVDFAFIAVYWLVFATTSALFATRDFWGASWLGAIAGELATIGALSDVSENVHALRLLDAPPGPAGSIVKAMRGSALVKWGCLFAATALLSVMFFAGGGLNVVLALVYVIPAAVGAVAIAADVAGANVSPVRLERMLRFGFFGIAGALAVGLPVAASQL